MSKPQPKGSYFVRTAQIFSASIRILSPGFLAELWKRSTREIYRWGADADHCSEVARNPLDLLSIQLDRLLELDRDDVVEAVLRLLAGPRGYQSLM